MDKDFLLETKTARKLFHDFADKMPIIDYHCHIDAADIADDKKYDNITQVWLYGDHYKWRAIRSNGVDEKYITGDASDYEKFEKFAETMPKLIGNPLYHWAHLELKTYFGYEGVLSKDTAKQVWDICNDKLKDMSVRSIIEESNVKLICTTDDPVDSLDEHKKIKEDKTCSVKVLPAFRPDKAMNIEKEEFISYIDQLEKVSGVRIENYNDLKNAIINRIDYFDNMSCLASDHAFEYVRYIAISEDEVDRLFFKRLNGDVLDNAEIDAYKSAFMLFVGKQYAKRNWVMQIHYGTLRNNNTRNFDLLGADTGFDCITTKDSARGLSDLLNALDIDESLPKTIIYSLNPNDNAMIGTVIGCFQGSEIAGKIQHGSAWWFNDTKEGMISQLKTLASLSVLGNFIGMLTDSRSFLSYTRHEYFRRILCNLIGSWIENGEYFSDMETLSQIVKDICYNNVVKYFGFPV